MTTASLPKYNDFHWPTVLALRALGGSGSNSEIDEKVVAQEGFRRTCSQFCITTDR